MKETSTQKAVLIVAAIVIVGALAAVSLNRRPSSSSNTGAMSSMSPVASSSAQAAVATDAVTISSFAFGPAVITVKAGTAVTWTNQDSVNHTVTSDAGTELASSLFGRGQSFSHTFAVAGTYTYHCMPHPYMLGTVVVTN